jgi:SAM-dependent methyltransferase
MNSRELIHALDDDALRVFAAKGTQAGPEIPQQGNANAVKVRRILQLTRDLAGKSFDQLRILDLACGEGVYSIEAALRGAEVVAIDGRTERMNDGVAIAKRAGLTRLRFEEGDIRAVTRHTHGKFDVVYFLGILYHLDGIDACRTLEHIREMTDGLLVVDTHIALTGGEELEFRGQRYAGARHREHDEGDSAIIRKARVLMSLDNTYSYWFTRDSLVRLLVDVGFPSVGEIHAPLEPGKPEHRVTLFAGGTERVKVSAYPWVNDLPEEAIAQSLQSGAANTRLEASDRARQTQPMTAAGFVNRVLRTTLGVELHRASGNRRSSAGEATGAAGRFRREQR